MAKLFKERKITFILVGLILIVGVATGLNVLRSINQNDENSDIEIVNALAFEELSDVELDRNVEDDDLFQEENNTDVFEESEEVDDETNLEIVVSPEMKAESIKEEDVTTESKITEPPKATQETNVNKTPSTPQLGVADVPQLGSQQTEDSGLDFLGQMGLDYYIENYGDQVGTSGLRADVINYGCHIEIHIFQNDTFLAALVYFNGEIFEI